MSSADILPCEASRLYENQDAGLRKLYERMRLLAVWQTKWDKVKNVQCETSDDLTQFLSKHSGLWKYLYRFGLDEPLDCPTCEDVAEGAERGLFTYPKFKSLRGNF